MQENVEVGRKKARPVERLKSQVPNLKTLLQDPDVANFFNFIHENSLRTRALELLSEKLSKKK